MKLLFQTHNIFVVTYLQNLLQRSGIDAFVSDEKEIHEHHGFHKILVEENTYNKAMRIIHPFFPENAA